MAQGKALTDWQEETIRATWLLTENGSEAARLAGCAPTTANAYIREHMDELLQLRQQKAPELSEVISALLQRLVSAAFDPAKLADASLGHLMTGIGILIDKHQLITGKATARTETNTIDPSKLTPEEREMAARIREKLAAEVGV
jgi:recombinational DNA repair protein (RecF pathway)